MIEVIVDLDSIEWYLLAGYCCGKGILWNLLFGWRKTDFHYNVAYYKISVKDWKEIKEIAGTIKMKNKE